jgi:hypothetical protein
VRSFREMREALIEDLHAHEFAPAALAFEAADELLLLTFAFGHAAGDLHAAQSAYVLGNSFV